MFYCIQTPAAKQALLPIVQLHQGILNIPFVLTPLAKFMIANNNTILSVALSTQVFHRHYGIWMSEANPNASVRATANGNTINLYNAQHGIYSGVLNTAAPNSTTQK